MTVEEGTLACEDEAVTFTTGGKTYALNGPALALAPGRGWIDIRESGIWAKESDPKLAKLGLKKSMVLIDRGLKLCK